MKQLIRVDTHDDVLNLLYEFDEVFPHLKEKVADYDAYALKLKENAFVYKAMIDGKVFGILVFYANDFHRKKAYVSLIGVKKEYRSMGLGRYLMDSCIMMSKKNGMTKLFLEVDFDNKNAMEFYKKAGFMKDANASKSSIYMKKEL